MGDFYQYAHCIDEIVCMDSETRKQMLSYLYEHYPNEWIDVFLEYKSSKDNRTDQ